MSDGEDLMMTRYELSGFESLDLSALNRTRVEILFTDLALATSFIAVAESSAGERRKRNIAQRKRCIGHD